MKNISILLFKGGPGSGRKPIGRKPKEQISTGKPKVQTSSASTGKFNFKKYRTLDAKARVTMSATFLNKYKNKYIVKSQQEKATAKLTPAKKKLWMQYNKNAGALEGARKATIVKGNKAQGKERRKWYCMAISYQQHASSSVAERNKIK